MVDMSKGFLLWGQIDEVVYLVTSGGGVVFGDV